MERKRERGEERKRVEREKIVGTENDGVSGDGKMIRGEFDSDGDIDESNPS